MSIAVPAFDVDPVEAAELAAAEIMGFRTIPQRGNFLAISMVKSRYREDPLMMASIANGESTRDQLLALAITDVLPAIEFMAYCSGYLTARMFWPKMGESDVLSRIIKPDSDPVPDTLRLESIERSAKYLPALSDIHDNRASPRDSRLVQKLLSHYLAVLIEDPRQSTLETLIHSYNENDTQRVTSGLTARMIADALDHSRLWATLGWRRGQAERRFRVVPRNRYIENIAGDVRILFEPQSRMVSFSDVRRVRYVDQDKASATPHPCDDEVIGRWIADNCALARTVWTKPD